MTALFCYLDSSALVKCYLPEPGSIQLRQFIDEAYAVGTVSISRAETVATFGKALRLGALERDEAEAARRLLMIDWRDLATIEVSEFLIDRASDFSWGYGLRGYDSVQLAAAMEWQEILDAPLVMATFDVQLWKTAARLGLEPYPPDLPGIR